MKIQSPLVSIFALFSLLSQTFVGITFAQEFPQAPNEVQNVVAVSGNGQVTLTWDETEDPDGVVNEYKVYYGKTSVQTAEGVYEDEVVVGKNLTYTVENLLNETEYFFAVTAIDDEQTESETYSVEVSATPVDPSSKFMKILTVQQNGAASVQIEMSKDAFFAGDPRNAFVISEKESGDVLEFTEAQVKNAQLIFIMAHDFVPGKAYQIVANDEVFDTDKNTVEKGNMDRIEFVAKQVSPLLPEAETPPEETTIPVLPPEGSSLQPDGTTIVADARNFSVDTSLLKSEQLVVLGWEIAETPNIADQVLFTRRGLEDWDNGYSIGTDITELELEVDMNENYEVQLVTVDGDGNESTGVSLTFSTRLATTGPGSIGTVIALLIIFMIGLIFFRKQQTC